jgi:uncharacterized protein (DUF1501 family)
MDVPNFSRRDWLRLTTAGVLGGSLSRWLPALAADAARHPQRRRSCILLWMNGGPSTIDLWDLKPGHANGGPFKEVATAVPGLKIGEHLPKLAGWTNHLAVVRSMSTREGDHGRASYLARTGSVPQAGIQFPAIGALVAKELGDTTADLPSFVCVNGSRGLEPMGTGSGFLGPVYAPLDVLGQANGEMRVANLDRPAGVSAAEFESRLGLLHDLDQSFQASRPGAASSGHRIAYERATRLMRTTAASALNLNDEPANLRDAYGRTPFGQGCLLARRLVERGVPFVEVSLDNWDTHQNNFDQVRGLCQTLDAGWSALLHDLKDRGLLESTTILWMGEFGRTPKINPQNGRDHHPDAWSTVLAGGGIKGGRAIGRTSAGGEAVEDRPVSIPDLLATLCLALGIDVTKTNPSNVGRPIRIMDQSAKPIHEIVG